MSDFLRRALLDYRERIDWLARRRFRDPTLADAAANFVLDQLQADGFARLRAHDGRASLSTFLGTVVTRLLEDYARARSGRAAVPDWVSMRGPLWRRLYTLLCLERHPFRDAVELAQTLLGLSEARTLVEDAARAIRARYPNCGKPGEPEVRLDEPPPEPPDPSQRDPLMADALGDLLAELGGHLLPERVSAPADSAGEGTRSRLQIDLTPEERLLLTLEFRCGLSVSEAGRRLGLSPHAAHGKRRRTLERIRAELREAGLGWGPEDVP